MIKTQALIPKLKKLKARRVFLQVPEGLKTRVQDMASKIEEAGFSVMLSVEPCFGACDIKDREAKALGCDVLVHIGHSDFGVKPVLPVIYEEYRVDFDPTPLLRANLKDLKKYRRIGMFTTLQYISSLAKASKFLREKGLAVRLGSGRVVRYPGQILGCDISGPKSVENQVDCFLFIGTGSFHPLGLALEVEKPVLFLDFESGQLIDLVQEKQSLEKLRYARIAKAAEARNFGVLVSTKPGQAHPATAWKTKKRLEDLGRKAWILVADQVTPEKLLGLKIEALVDTACPRLQEDSRQFKKPIISPQDLTFLEESC